MKRILIFLAGYIALSALLAIVAVVTSTNSWPRTLSGWLLMLVLIIPVTLAGELVGELLFRNRLSQSVERHTQLSQFSWLRVGYMLLILLLFCAALAALSYWF